MALYVTRPRRDEVRIGRGLPSALASLPSPVKVTNDNSALEIAHDHLYSVAHRVGFNC